MLTNVLISANQGTAVNGLSNESHGHSLQGSWASGGAGGILFHAGTYRGWGRVDGQANETVVKMQSTDTETCPINFTKREWVRIS